MPIVVPGNSDSATFDNVLELLMLAGRSLPHAVMMMIPEAYADRDDLPDDLKGFYAFHSCLMEPWDGPAAVAFTDGRVVGATLDRNGLRPGRWVETHDGLVVLGSEAGLLPIKAAEVKRLGRLQPGKLFLVDLERDRIVEDEEVKRDVSTQQPYGEWFERNTVHFDDLAPAHVTMTGLQPTQLRQLAFGYTQEDLRVLIAPMATTGAEPIGSMGNDNALAVLSDRRPPLFSYFKQLFAQVTNPPIDPIRESIVMSLATGVGAEQNLLTETPEHAHQLILDQPILRNHELETLRNVHDEIFRAHTLDITWEVDEGPGGLRARLAKLCDDAHDAVAAGVNVLILSDRRVGPRRAAIPSLLAVAAVHHHLVREGTRLRAGLVLESGEPREVHHMATLIGYGCGAINPYLLFDTVGELVGEGRVPGIENVDTAERNIVKAIGKGLLKTISKMGISTIQSYCGAQIFEAVGLERDLDRPPLHRHGVAHRRHRPRRPRPRDARPPRAGLPGRPRAAAARRRHLRLAPRRRAPHVEPGDDRAAAARGARRRVQRRRPGEVPRVRGARQRRRVAQGDAARAAEVQDRRRRRRSRSTRSSRPRRSSSASPPARCRSARSRASRTRRSRSR